MDIIVTGANGFIGGAVARYLKILGHRIIAVDLMASASPEDMQWMSADKYINFQELIPQAKYRGEEFDAIVHMGACADTTCADREFLKQRNTKYSKLLWSICIEKRKPLIYASSAATYGTGEQGFDDDSEKIWNLKPLNPYAKSKHYFDLSVIGSCMKHESPPQWAGLKFFNVYGSSEQKKGRMASMIFQAMQQARATGKIRLFKSGEQKRDFIHVSDVCRVIEHMLFRHQPFGIYNVGTGVARSFNDMARAIFTALDRPCNIEYFDMPESLKGLYQDFTEAKVSKLRTTFKTPFLSLEEGIKAS